MSNWKEHRDKLAEEHRDGIDRFEQLKDDHKVRALIAYHKFTAGYNEGRARTIIDVDRLVKVVRSCANSQYNQAEASEALEEWYGRMK